MSAQTFSGIEVLGDISWGTHFCQFYETPHDLLEILVPYFKAGLERKEFCLWIVTNPEVITKEDAKAALGKAVPNLSEEFTAGNIEIVSATEWYLAGGLFNIEKVMSAWHEKYKQILGKNFTGMRVSGDTFWLGEKNWKDFHIYEKKLDDFIAGLRMNALCTYSLKNCGAAEILDAVRNHCLTIVRRQGKWEMIEIAVQQRALEELTRLKDEKQQTKTRPPRLTVILRYIVPVLSVAIALVALVFMKTKLTDDLPYMAIFFCAVIVSTWIGGVKPGLLSILLGALVFDYFFLPPIYSFAIEPVQISRLVMFIMPSLFIIWLSADQGKITESLRRARNVLEQTVQKLRQTNAVLRTEVAERKQAEETLRQSEDRIRLIIDTIPIMAWTTDTKGIVDFLSKRWMDYTGLSFEQYVGDPMGPVHPDDVPRVLEKWRMKMEAEESYDDEMRLRAADGRYRWFLVRTAPLYNDDGNLSKWYGISIDIEDSKQAEDKLQLAYQRLSYHVENTPLAVIEFDRDLFVKRWSKRAEEIFGWEAGEALGKNVYDADFRIIYKEDLPAVDTINEELTKGMVDWNLSLNRNYTKDGNVIYCEWYNSVLKDERGNVITILSLVHNVTQRKRTEEKLQQVNTELRNLSSHLQNIHESERTAIAREIHDELGQLLTGLKMEVGWLDKKLPDELPLLKEKGKEILSLISETLKRVKRIAMDLRPNILDELGLVEALVWQGQEFQKRTGVKLKFFGTTWNISLTKNLSTNVFRIYQEALTNIARHANATLVETTLELRKDHLYLVIKDNGKGFDVNEARKADSLGLIGMKERAVLLKGDLMIESNMLNGSTVTLKVPCLSETQ